MPLRPLARILLGVSAFALFSAIAIPHQHDHSAASHPASACRACKIQDGFSADPGPSAVVAVLSVPFVRRPAARVQAPARVLVVRLGSPRAPPALS